MNSFLIIYSLLPYHLLPYHLLSLLPYHLFQLPRRQKEISDKGKVEDGVDKKQINLLVYSPSIWNIYDFVRQIILAVFLRKICVKFVKWKMWFKNRWKWTSLVAQWLRIRLPVQGTWVRALVQEDPMCRRATKPVCHNYWACALEPVLRNKRSHRNEKPAHCHEE